MRFITTRQALLTLALFNGMALGTLAQGLDTMPARGFLPNHLQMSDEIDNIDVSSGKLNLTIPLGSLPRGPGGSSFTLNLRYESNRYDLVPNEEYYCVNTNDLTGNLQCNFHYRWAKLKSGNGGWTYRQYPYRIEIEVKPITNWKSINGLMQLDPDCSNVGGRPQPTMQRFRVVLPDGSARVLYLRGSENLDERQTGFYPFNKHGTNTMASCASDWRGKVPKLTGVQTFYTAAI